MKIKTNLRAGGGGRCSGGGGSSTGGGGGGGGASGVGHNSPDPVPPYVPPVSRCVGI